jgi:hypothetical protein
VLSVCPTPITLNELVHFQEIQHAGHVIECDLNAILFNPVLSTIPKYRTLKLASHIKNLNHSTCDDEILYADRASEDEKLLLETFFLKTTKILMCWAVES